MRRGEGKEEREREGVRLFFLTTVPSRACASEDCGGLLETR